VQKIFADNTTDKVATEADGSELGVFMKLLLIALSLLLIILIVSTFLLANFLYVGLLN
jgi:hypothetical protein